MNKTDLKTVIEKIKTRGYWKFVVEPTKPISIFFEHIRDAEKLAKDSSIELRGWDYPHIPAENSGHQGIEIQNDRLNGFIDWNHFIEAWTFFDSGQFVHILALREDWFKESGWVTKQDRLKKIEPNSILDFVGTTLTSTEMFLFAKNLANSEKYGDSLRVIISLHNMQNRVLQTIDPNRIPLFFDYRSTAKKIIGFDKVVNKSELNVSYLELAEQTAVRIFKFFRGFNPPIQVIEEDQKKLIERRL